MCVCESVRVLVCERVVWVIKLCVSKLCVCVHPSNTRHSLLHIFIQQCKLIFAITSFAP